MQAVDINIVIKTQPESGSPGSGFLLRSIAPGVLTENTDLWYSYVVSLV